MSTPKPPAVPRATCHHGSVLASGYWVSNGASDAQTRVLALWEEGAQVRQTPGGFLLLLARERRVIAELGAALPIVKQGQCLSSAPLRPRELEVLRPGTLLLVLEGRTLTLALEHLEILDPSQWLDVDDFVLHGGKSLGATAAPTAALSKPLDPQVMFDQSVGRSADDNARQAEVLRALQRAAQPDAGHGSTSGQGARVLGLLVEMLRGAASRFRRWGRKSTPARPSADSRLARPSPLGPTLWQRLTAAFANWLARTRIASFIGRKHAEYLRNLFELLAQHDDEEVLRRAIPLGKGEGGASSPALLPPSPRTTLDISFGPQASRSSLGLVPGLFEQLRRSYEAVFQRLDAAGKHEQAAYFLAEILNEPERAVAYLERHGERVLAARLAESRQLAPGLIVRQWFLAGDRERAILIAVREGAFGDAIVRLERSGHLDEAIALRSLQAERLASAGLFVRAAQVVQRDEHGKRLALRWLELARGAGDLRGIPLELSLAEDRFDAAHAALAPLLASGAFELPTLLVVADEFAAQASDVGKPLARELGRELLAIAASTGMAGVAAAAVRVANYVGGTFKADQPRLLTFEKRAPHELLRYEYAANSGGTTGVLDLHRFGSHMLVALGEAGVVLLNRQGTRVAHFELPAHALVTAPGSGRVLCVAPRGDRLEVGRIDLATRRCQRWCELQAASFSPDFDGETWLVCTGGYNRAQEGELLQLDVLDAEPRILRRLPMPLQAPRIHIEDRQVNLIGAEPAGAVERMRYELPQLTLRQRQVVIPFEAKAEDRPPRFFLGDVAAQGERVPSVYERWNDESAPVLKVRARVIALPSVDPEARPRLSLCSDFYALTLASETRSHIWIGPCTATTPRVELVLHGAAQVALRWHAGLLLIGDSAGRILGFDPQTGAPVYDLRT